MGRGFDDDASSGKMLHKRKEEKKKTAAAVLISCDFHKCQQSKDSTTKQWSVDLDDLEIIDTVHDFHDKFI